MPRVTKDRRSFAHDVCTDPVKVQKIHSAVEACQVPHESSETRAVNGVLENLGTSGLDEVLLTRDVRSAIRILVNPARVGREGETMAEKCSKYLHQSNGTSENAMENIETTVTASDCESPEWLGCQVDSETIAPSQIGYTVRVLSQSERCRDDHNVRVRLRTRRSRAELMLKSETVNPEHVRGEMAKLNPSEATETSLDSTNRDGERLPQSRTTRKQWQQNAFTIFTGVPRNPKKWTENRKKCISRFSIERYGETPGSSECLGASSRRTTTCREGFERPFNPNATDVTPEIPSAVEDPSPADDAASTRQQHATQLDTRSTFTKLLERRDVRRSIRCFRQQRELMRLLQYFRSCCSCVLTWR